MYDIDPRRQQRLKVLFAAVLGGAGVAILALLFATSEFPSPIWLWALFAFAFFALEWNAVEVNDRLFASPTVMVLMTAAVIFGHETAVLGASTMAATGMVSAADVRQRRWFQPIVNGGQFVISAAASATVLVLLLPDEITVSTLWIVTSATALAAVVHSLVNYGIVTLIVRTVFGHREIRPWSKVGAIMVPMVGMGLLGGLLGAAYHLVGSVTLPLIFVVFFVGRMTFASYAQLREAQESTLRGFIKALEAKDLYTRGHTERVAYFSDLIGRAMGFNGTRLEQLRWAALIHDVGKLAVPRDIIRKKARLSTEEWSQMQAHTHLVEDLLAEVDFLQPMVAIASNHHTHFDGNGYHGSRPASETDPPLEARILAIADSFDAMTSTRSYRVALTQEYAFAELRHHAGTQFDPDVVEAFIEIIERRGERYGSPDVASDAEARRRAEQGGSRPPAEATRGDDHKGLIFDG
jgi:hypothetical protein